MHGVRKLKNQASRLKERAAFASCMRDRDAALKALEEVQRKIEKYDIKEGRI